MRSFRRSDRGLSEIVGTLMLIVIVVSAATLLAAFVASYQRQLQSQEAYTHDQDLESIKIFGIATSLNVAGSAYRGINFTLASESGESSGILGIEVNSIALYTYWWEDQANHTWSECGLHLGCTLVLAPLQQVFVATNTSTTNNSYTLGSPPLPNQYLKIDVFTNYQNDFRQVFLPPAPIALVSETNPSGNNPITLLDGSTSFQPGGNASLVNWAWTASGGGRSSTGTSLPPSFNQSGIAVNNGKLGPGNVTVNSASAIFPVPAGFHWTTGDTAIFALSSENLTIAGSGTCSLSGTSAPDINYTRGPPVVSAGILTVYFNFNTTVSMGCSSATVSLVFSGVTLLVNSGQVTLTANGVEVEISPALPALPSGSFDLITLQVLNSDGLTGSTNVTFGPPT
ncbi:MAG TPA: archaellin/type IV pilin N-terminal domain-containing protein [Thermoplasmata archaeon]|nr:archaellin/type IV pilin N-terminal domain-containing protein [Thermoplasmata archaeon]